MAKVFHLKSGDGFFDQVSMGYLLPDMILVTEIQEMDASFTDTGQNFVFKVYLKSGMDIELGYKTHKEAFAARRDIILDMMGFWGPDQIVFSNGFHCEVTIIAGVLSVTEVFEKENWSSFSVMVQDVPFPVNLILPDRPAAEEARQSILDKLESYRCQSRRPEPVAVNQ